MADASDDGPDRHPDSPAVDGAGDADGRSRRWLVRLLVGLGLGIPIALEATTFLGLIRRSLLGEDDGTPSPTPEGRLVGIGDELLPATGPVETMTDAAIEGSSGDAWSLRVVVDVENTGDSPYAFRLGEVTTASGDAVSGGGATGEIPPGETVTLRASWSLPAGSTPETMVVQGLTYPEGGTVARVREVVRLRNVPVEG